MSGMEPRPDEHGGRRVAAESLLTDRSALDELREWAWERGRTDVIGRLDVHAAASAFVAGPTVAHLVRLAQLLPVRPRSGWVESAVHELMARDAEASRREALARNLGPWLAVMRWQLIADFDEMSGAGL
jgi:hypothetical protein